MKQRNKDLLINKFHNFFRVIISIFWLTRITITLPILFVGICAFILCNTLIFNYNNIILILIPPVVAASGFILNDIFDFKKDKINRPQRPLPSNSISLAIAYALFITLFILSMVLIITIDNSRVFYLYIFATLLTMLYSVVNKYNGILGNLVTALLSIGPWLGPALYTNQLNIVAVPALATFCLIFSREILLDIKDIQGDKINQFSTLPIIFGKHKASLISFLIMFIMNVIVVIYGIVHNYSNWYFLLIFIGFIIPSAFYLIIIINKKLTYYLDALSNIGKLQFIIGLMSFLIK